MNPALGQRFFARGLAAHQQGKLAEAEADYRRALEAGFSDADVWHLLGLTLGQRGRFGEAVELIGQAIGQRPNAVFLNSRGEMLRRAGKLEEARGDFQRSIELNAAYPEAFNNLGNVLEALGDDEEAARCYESAVQQRPDYAEAHFNRGRVLEKRGDADAAERSFREALARNPNLAEAHNSLGNGLLARGRPADAESCFAKAVELQPAQADYIYNLGNARAKQGKWDEAIACFQQCLAVRPDFPEAANNLGNTFRKAGRPREAIEALQLAIRLRPGSVDALNNLGFVLQTCGAPDQAESFYQQALQLNPAFGEALNNLGCLYKDQGLSAEAIVTFRTALEKGFPAWSNLLFTLNGSSEISTEELFAEHRRWGQAVPADQKPSRKSFSRGREKLRIGFVSADFRLHAVACFTLGWIGKLRPETSLYLYGNHFSADGITEQFREAADGWRCIAGMSDEQALDAIRQDEIDLLIDLGGHTAHNRLPLFGLRPAPVQATYLGYPATTGLPTMDFRITDAVADPLGAADEWHTEKLIRLPGCAWCYTPLYADAHQTSVPPAKQGRPLTFGSFNNASKISNATLALWAKILQAVPEAQLYLKAEGFTAKKSRDRVIRTFQEAGIDPARLRIEGWKTSLGDHLLAYTDVDIALDPLPYGGTTTTCEALWMGVPVLTLAGDRHSARVGASLLTAIGRSEWVAHSEDALLELARACMADAEARRSVRQTLRREMLESPLMDADRFAGNFLEHAVRAARDQAGE